MTTQGVYKEAYSPYAQAKRDLRGVKKLTDEQIMQYSAIKAKHDVEKSPSGKIYKVLPAIAITTIAGIVGASRGGKLSNKLSAAAGVIGVYAAGSLILNGFDKVVNKIEKSKEAKNKESQMNPFLKFTLGLAASLGVLYAGFAGIKKGKTVLTKQFADTDVVANITKIKKDVAKVINKSWFGKKAADISKGYQGFVKKHPGLQKNVLSHAFPAAIIGWFMATVGLGTSLNKKMGAEFVKNANDLATMREEANVALKFIKHNEKHPPQSDTECDKLCKEEELAQEKAEETIKEVELARKEGRVTYKKV